LERATFILNGLRDRNRALDQQDAAFLNRTAAEMVERLLARCPVHETTPIHNLPHLAKALGVGSVFIKDESDRLNLGSFMALGGAYAVIRLVLDEAVLRLGRVVDADQLFSPEVREIASTMTFACATDGNHGRSIAAGSRLVGARASLFVHEGVSSTRVEAIRCFGADLITVRGTYDDAVDEAETASRYNGWILVSDTSRNGYEQIPGIVMQGYTALIREALASLAELPTHVFVQAGVGGLAAAIAAYLALTFAPAEMPKVIVVEPERAACLFGSVRAGKRTKVSTDEPTAMAMLECYEPSLTAWRILIRCAHAFMTVSDTSAALAKATLAWPKGNDRAIRSSESGAAGLAALMTLADDVASRRALDLSTKSRVADQH